MCSPPSPNGARPILAAVTVPRTVINLSLIHVTCQKPEDDLSHYRVTVRKPKEQFSVYLIVIAGAKKETVRTPKDPAVTSYLDIPWQSR